VLYAAQARITSCVPDFPGDNRILTMPAWGYLLMGARYLRTVCHERVKHMTGMLNRLLKNSVGDAVRFIFWPSEPGQKGKSSSGMPRHRTAQTDFNNL
jgi:hypothetical protein